MTLFIFKITVHKLVLIWLIILNSSYHVKLISNYIINIVMGHVTINVSWYNRNEWDCRLDWGTKPI